MSLVELGHLKYATMVNNGLIIFQEEYICEDSGKTIFAKSFIVKDKAEVEKIVTALKMYLDDTKKQSMHLGDNRYLYIIKDNLHPNNDKLTLFNTETIIDSVFVPSRNMVVKGNKNLKNMLRLIGSEKEA